MKRFAKVLLAAMVLAGVCGCAILTNFHFREARDYMNDPALAQYDGTVKVPGLDGRAEVYRDEHGVPHVFADTEHDLFFSAGYVQAQDRLWEMMLMRALAEGRTAELFGDLGVPGVHLLGMPLSTVKFDEHQRIMGLKYMGEVGEVLIRELDPAMNAKLEAYCAGVNFYIDSLDDERLPVEFQVLKIRPQRYRVRDIASFTRLIGSLLASNLPIELARQAAIQKYGPDKGWELFPLHLALGPTIVPNEILENRLDSPRDIIPGGRPSALEIGFDSSLSAADAETLLAADSAWRDTLKMNTEIGSNNWIVSGKLTESGNAILANDPHLQHLEPSLFYLIHLKGAGFDCMGATFPGNPFVVLGHNRDFAWGATTSRADVQDLFVETTDDAHPGQYLHRGLWKDFIVREEIINVRSGSRMKEKKIEIRHSVHGPIVNDFGLPKGAPPVALRWTGWDVSRDLRAFDIVVGSKSAEEVLQKVRALDEPFELLNIAASVESLMKAKSIDDFKAAMEILDLPNQNWVGADNQGRIAYLPGGLVPIRGKGIGVLPAPGASGDFDWTGFIPLMEIPHAIDPERGYMATANNQVVDARHYPYVFSTHYGVAWRAWRIEELIKELAPLSVDDMVRIQNDVQVVQARWTMPIVLAAIEGREIKDDGARRALAELQSWDYEASLDSSATVVFFEFIKALFNNVFEDEVDQDTFKTLRPEGNVDMLLDVQLNRGDSPFFDDKRTKEVEDLGDMVIKSLADAMAVVDKKWGPKPEDHLWGDIHMIKFYHPLGFGKMKTASVGPFPYEGASQTVRNASVAGFGRWPYKTIGGACLRHIIDLGDPDGALIMIDGSVSGQWLSPHYDDLHPLFVNGEYITADKDPGRVKAAARYRLTLEP